MLSRLTKRLFTPTTRFEIGKAQTSEQADAQKRMLELQNEAEQFSSRFTRSSSGSDNLTIADQFGGYTGHVEFGEGNEIKELELKSKSFDGDDISIRKEEGRTDIHKIRRIDGPVHSIWEPSILVQEEWLTFDDKDASYKKIDYFTN